MVKAGTARCCVPAAWPLQHHAPVSATHPRPCASVPRRAGLPQVRCRRQRGAGQGGARPGADRAGHPGGRGRQARGCAGGHGWRLALSGAGWRAAGGTRGGRIVPAGTVCLVCLPLTLNPNNLSHACPSLPQARRWRRSCARRTPTAMAASPGRSLAPTSTAWRSSRRVACPPAERRACSVAAQPLPAPANASLTCPAAAPAGACRQRSCALGGCTRKRACRSPPACSATHRCRPPSPTLRSLVQHAPWATGRAPSGSGR